MRQTHPSLHVALLIGVVPPCPRTFYRALYHTTRKMGLVRLYDSNMRNNNMMLMPASMAMNWYPERRTRFSFCNSGMRSDIATYIKLAAPKLRSTVGASLKLLEK